MKSPFVAVLEDKEVVKALVLYVLRDLGLPSIICPSVVFEFDQKDNSVRAILTLQQEGDT